MAAGIVLASILTGLLLSMPAVEKQITNIQVSSFKANATVIEKGNDTQKLGIVTNPQLRFGSIPEGSKSIKFLNLDAPRKSLVWIKSSGNISQHLIYNKKNYFQGEKEISIKFNASETGYYVGDVDIHTQAPKNKWGNRWLDIKSRFYPW